ncbi:MAG: lysophospholipid acyltransferase family protein [Candidatus Omnitrophica bacterium]|nr:lysophospholipid acyltransferase family protein [Candidatus Omnitrophota bacterium]
MKKNFLNKDYAYKISVWFAGILPVWFLRSIAKIVAFFGYIFFDKARNNVRQNLAQIYDDPKLIETTTKNIFLNYGKYISDWAKLNHVKIGKLGKWFSSFQGEEVIKKGLSKGKGIILLTAHLGNWELGGLFFSHRKIPINVITAQDDIKGLAEIRENSRKAQNIKTITINNDSLFFIDIVNALQKNELVAMLIDRYEGRNCVEVDFFGRPTCFPMGPVQLAKSTGAAIIPAFIVADEKGKYKAIADSVVEMEFTGDTREDIKKNTEKLVRILEKYILQYSDQWYNFTNLWGKKHE